MRCDCCGEEQKELFTAQFVVGGRVYEGLIGNCCRICDCCDKEIKIEVRPTKVSTAKGIERTVGREWIICGCEELTGPI